jgi:phospholipid transport system substrate-binding protein
MKRRIAAVLIVGLAVALQGAPALAQAGPRERVEAANRRIHELVSKQAPQGSPAATQRDEALRAIVNDLLDLDDMSRQALGRAWDERTEAERRDYLEVMRQLVERSYLRQARERTQYTLTIGRVDVDAARNEATVETELRFQTRGRQETIEVVYTLARRNGLWKVTDIETDGASMVSNYRTSFRRILREEGFPELLSRMRRRLAEGETEL